MGNERSGTRIHRRVVQPVDLTEHIWFYAKSGLLASLPDEDIEAWVRASPLTVVQSMARLNGRTSFSARVRACACRVLSDTDGVSNGKQTRASYQEK